VVGKTEDRRKRARGAREALGEHRRTDILIAMPVSAGGRRDGRPWHHRQVFISEMAARVSHIIIARRMVHMAHNAKSNRAP